MQESFRHVLVNAGLSQNELAYLYDVSATTVRRWQTDPHAQVEEAIESRVWAITDRISNAMESGALPLQWTGAAHHKKRRDLLGKLKLSVMLAPSWV